MRVTELFRPGQERSPAEERVYAIYELLYTAVDATAGLLFMAGSVLFLLDLDQTVARLLFLAGSILFVSKPVIRLVRELVLYRDGATDRLAHVAERHRLPPLSSSSRQREGHRETEPS